MSYGCQDGQVGHLDGLESCTDGHQSPQEGLDGYNYHQVGHNGCQDNIECCQAQFQFGVNLVKLN